MPLLPVHPARRWLLLFFSINLGTTTLWNPTKMGMHSAVALVSVASQTKATRRLVIHYSKSVQLGASHRPYMEHDNNHDESSNGNSSERQRPTQTDTHHPQTQVEPTKPKILVLGATGLVGRRIVQQLLSQPQLEATTIVAFVRDYDKACRVLYDDLVVANSRKKGPKLQIVLGNLVPPEELPVDPPLDETEEHEWRERAESAAEFFGNSLSIYDNSSNIKVIESDEALQETIKSATTIISCVGEVRRTNFWTDILPVWRLLQKDVSKWCADPRHPYYVHYRTTAKVLHLAEQEQKRRDRMASDDNDAVPTTPRIRIVRISDLCVSQKPWHFIPIFTNSFHSMVFRYHDMAERALERSTCIDTITLRPGDLTDDERNAETTTLQVDPRGVVPSPARVGRDDVAALAVAAALHRDNQLDSINHKKLEDQQRPPPFHYTLACRWAGEQLHPYPAQGTKLNGLANAHLCMEKVFRTLHKQPRRNRIRRKPFKPYGICVAIPVYFMLAMMIRSFLFPLLNHIPGLAVALAGLKRLVDPLIMSLAVLLSQLGRSLVHMMPFVRGLLGRKAPYISL